MHVAGTILSIPYMTCLSVFLAGRIDHGLRRLDRVAHCHSGEHPDLWANNNVIQIKLGSALTSLSECVTELGCKPKGLHLFNCIRNMYVQPLY
jgi:hypothetical protein